MLLRVPVTAYLLVQAAAVVGMRRTMILMVCKMLMKSKKPRKLRKLPMKSKLTTKLTTTLRAGLGTTTRTKTRIISTSVAIATTVVN